MQSKFTVFLLCAMLTVVNSNKLGRETRKGYKTSEDIFGTVEDMKSFEKRDQKLSALGFAEECAKEGCTWEEIRELLGK